MRRATPVVLCAVIAAACSPQSSENSASCGFAAMAGATMLLEQLRGGGRFIETAPEGFQGTVPARVVGYGTTAALVAYGPDGAMVGYEGPGFPTLPGWGLLIVEDSLDTFKGVLIYETEPPTGAPLLGGVVGGNYTVPLYGARVTWSAVSSERCPMFAPLDTADTG
ncbi:MAG: hypothetical protein JSW43_12035 [Gemmatimonadota bacterium]|nr:MAG: hypothetical protein JSW43_12035 [Gemmatimonadota bacterium]